MAIWSALRATRLPGSGPQPVRGLQAEIVRTGRRTPCLFFDAPSTRDGVAGAGQSGDQTVLFYGHLDKQPEMTGWRAGLGPWQPVIQDGRLYGRGAADDGLRRLRRADLDRRARYLRVCLVPAVSD